jgi:hypothetical protein
MPKLEFWFTDHDAIMWTFDRHPKIGEEVVLGDRGVFRVTAVRPDNPLNPNVKEYDCERVRDATREDLDAMIKRGVNQLP